MKEYTKIVRQVITEKVDPETGEVTSETKNDKLVFGESGDFYQLYSSVIAIIEQLKPIESKIFISTFKYANIENKLALTKNFKQEIATRNDCCYSAVGNAITVLVEKGLLIRLDTATYRINPRYFWKSNSSSRKKTLQYVLSVECPNC